MSDRLASVGLLRALGVLAAPWLLSCAVLAGLENPFSPAPTSPNAGLNCSPEQSCFSPCVAACSVRCKPSQLPEGARLNLYANGDLYLGRWAERLPEGAGLHVQCRSDRELARYEGEFRKGQREGSGMLTLSDGGRLRANWRANAPLGRGDYVAPDGTALSGEFVSSGQGGVFRSVRGERAFRLNTTGDAPFFEWFDRP